VTILLIGKNGQLGWELERCLAPLGGLAAFDREGFDLTTPEIFTGRLRELQPQIIVNAAAYTAVDRAETEPDLAHMLNATAPGILGEEAKRLGALLVHFSTDYVFDGAQTTPYREDDPPNPQSVYGKSKLEGERAIQASGCRHLILRIGWVYGTHGSNFLKTILSAARTQPALRVVNDQWGAPCSTARLAGVLRSVLERIKDSGAALSGSPGLYHLSPAGCTTWYEFALEIVTRFRLGSAVYPTTSESLSRPAKRPGNSLLDSSRFMSEFKLGLGHWHSGFTEVSRILSG